MGGWSDESHTAGAGTLALVAAALRRREPQCSSLRGALHLMHCPRKLPPSQPSASPMKILELEEPVMDLQGVVYERQVLEQWFKTKKTKRIFCPLAGERCAAKRQTVGTAGEGTAARGRGGLVLLMFCLVWGGMARRNAGGQGRTCVHFRRTHVLAP